MVDGLVKLLNKIKNDINKTKMKLNKLEKSKAYERKTNMKRYKVNQSW